MYSKSYSKCPKCGKNGTVTLKETLSATRHEARYVKVIYHAHCHACGVTVNHERNIPLHNMEPIDFGAPKPMKGGFI